MINDEVVRSVRTSTKPRKLFDEKGLYLLVVPAAGGYGDSSTVSRRELQETKKKCISLGSYPEISLVQVRERRDAARRDVANGIDPSLRRLIQQTLTPSHLHRRRSREPISANTVDTLERRLEMHVFPYIGTRDVQLLHARSCWRFFVALNVVERMTWRDRVSNHGMGPCTAAWRIAGVARPLAADEDARTAHRATVAPSGRNIAGGPPTYRWAALGLSPIAES